jgi:hypothetical protein
MYVVDLPAKFAAVKIGPTLLLRDPTDELDVILLCEDHPFQVVMTDELGGGSA